VGIVDDKGLIAIAAPHLVGPAGEALVVARRIFALGMLAKAEIKPLPAPR